MLIRSLTILSSAILFGIVFYISTYAQEIKFNHLTVDNGLSNNKVNCVLEDRTGFIWFGTEDGLNRFDGYDIKIYRHNPNDNKSISGNGIWAIFQDSEGFLWIGTKSGEINRYDPKTDAFENWKVESENMHENSITSIYVDEDKNLWIGTYRNGLYKFSIRENKFYNWQHSRDNANSLSNNYITSILQDSKGKLWVSTYDGLNMFNPSNLNNPFSRFYYNVKDTNTISNNLIWKIFPSDDDKNKFWIGTAKGLSYYNSENSTFSRLNIPFDNKLQFSNSVGSMVEEETEKEKVYWMGTYAGLVRVDLENNNIKRILDQDNNPFGLTSNRINEMIMDHSGVIWIATENGVNYFSSKEGRFNNPLSPQTNYASFDQLRKKNITAICQTNDVSIWIGNTEGLSVINNIDLANRLKTTLQSSKINVWSLCKGNSNNLWIGTYGQGVKELDLDKNIIRTIPIKSEIIMPSLYLYIKSILQDKHGFVWIGCWGSGLVRYDPSKKEYKIFINNESDKNSLSYNDVWTIFEDKLGNIWVGTNGGGLNLYDSKEEKFYRLFSDSKIKNGLSSNSIFSICESKNSGQRTDKDLTVLWVGTSNGLNKVTISHSDLINTSNQLKAKIKYYNTDNDLPDNSIKSIVEDDDGNLWLGTSNGLSKFDPRTEKFINYSTADGLNGNDFNYGASYKTKGGRILLGGVNGLNIFNPREIRQSSYHPPIVITDFQVFNRSVSVGEDSPLKMSISFTKEIQLSYDQNIFSFRFAALDYNSPQSIQYAYKLEGFDQDWVVSGKRNYAAYTNLSSGTYYFRVKSTNSDGLWVDNIHSVKVIINSPWWKTGWAFTMYLVIIVIGLIAIRRFELNRTKLRHELKMREFEANKFREIENIKSRFFANLSHEFRTPLMLIKGPIEQLRSGNIKSDTKNFYDIIYRNAEKLHLLIDQLLELTQLEAESIPLKARKENLVTQLKGIFYSFKSIAEQKNIVIEFESSLETICAWIDRDKLEKIINNILSNAFKFTPEGGMITLAVKIDKIGDEEYALIKISDTGIGIPKEKLSRIFDRFFQIDDSSGRAFGGSGIGLSLVKELVDLHKWKIELESGLSKGTSFNITIPLSDNYLSDYQKVSDESSNLHPDDQNQQNEIISEDSSHTKTADSHANHFTYESKLAKIASEKTKTYPTVLIVEDSEDIKEYIKSLLMKDYKIAEAENGETGLKVASETEPDIIISDIMMPGMDGIEFCKKIKTDLATSHIPIILLTAKVSQESKIEGFETGADDYITKPFSSKELIVRIKNLLSQRQRLKEKFSKEIVFQPDEVTVNSLDKEFLEKALSTAEKNILDENFDLDVFAEKMFLSRSQLYRKMVAITGQAPGEFLRIFRLKKAAQMILEKKLSVTQIALEVGFNSPSHFTKAFEQYFNCLPSEFVEKNRFNSTIR